MIRNVEATNFRKIFDGKRQFIIPFFEILDSNENFIFLLSQNNFLKYLFNFS
jgi:hypothetical protein